MKTITKIITALLIVLVLIAEVPVAQATTTSSFSVSTEPTILDVTITPVMNLTINPNIKRKEPGALTYNTINVVNNSTALLRIECTGLVNNSDGWFTIVPKDTYADWTNLSKEESKKIALGLKAEAGWEVITGEYWSSSIPGSKLDCTLKPGSTGTVVMSDSNTYYGTSYDSVRSSEFVLNWSVSLQ